MAFEIELLCSKLLLSLLTALNGHVPVIDLTLDPSGIIRSTNMDVSAIWMITFTLSRHAFGEFKLDRPTSITIRLPLFLKVLKVISAFPGRIFLKSNGEDKIDIISVPPTGAGFKAEGLTLVTDDSAGLGIPLDCYNDNPAIRLPSKKIAQVTSWHDSTDADSEIIFTITSEKMTITSPGEHVTFTDTILNPRHPTQTALIQETCKQRYALQRQRNKDIVNQSLHQKGNGIHKSHKQSRTKKLPKLEPDEDANSDEPDNEIDAIIEGVQEEFGMSSRKFGKFHYYEDSQEFDIITSIAIQSVSLRLAMKPVLVVAKISAISEYVNVIFKEGQPLGFVFSVDSFGENKDHVEPDGGTNSLATVGIFIAPRADEN